MNYTGSCRTGGSVQSAEVFSQRVGPVRRSSPVRKLASTIIFAIDPLSVYKLIEVLHRLIQCTEIYISTELSEIAHG